MRHRSAGAAAIAAAAFALWTRPSPAITITASASPMEAERAPISTVVTNELVMQLPASRNLGDLATLTFAPGTNAPDPVPGVDRFTFRIPGKTSKDRPTFPPGTTVRFGNLPDLPFGRSYSYVVDGTTAPFSITIRRPGERKPVLEAPFPVPIFQPSRPILDPVRLPPNAFETPPVALSGRVSVIRGPLSGDGSKTTVRIGDRAASIVAESPRAVFFQIPDDCPAGNFRISLEDGGRRVELPVTVLRMTMSADQLKLRKGQTTRFHVTISGPESWDAGAWRAGVPSDLCDMPELTKKFPEFRPPPAGGEGFLLFSITNLSPSVIAIEEFARSLSKKDFSSGAYTYEGGIGAVADGGFGIHGEVQAFLAPNTAESRPLEGGSPEKK